MDNKTVINPALQQSAQTVINNEIVEEYNRQNNINNSGAALVRDGATILDKYVVTRQLEVASGEADLYLCSCDGVQ